MSKGSMPRPLDCSKEHFDAEFERIFGVQAKENPPQPATITHTLADAYARRVAAWITGSEAKA